MFDFSIERIVPEGRMCYDSNKFLTLQINETANFPLNKLKVLKNI